MTETGRKQSKAASAKHTAKVQSRSFLGYIFAPFWAVVTPILSWLYVFIQVLIQWGFKPVRVRICILDLYDNGSL